MPKAKPFEKGNRRSPGRPKGSKSLTGRDLVNDIIQSYKELGGIKWLKALGETDAKTYTALLGKVVPKDMVIEAKVTIEDAIKLFDRETT